MKILIKKNNEKNKLLIAKISSRFYQQGKYIIKNYKIYLNGMIDYFFKEKFI